MWDAKIIASTLDDRGNYVNHCYNMNEKKEYSYDGEINIIAENAKGFVVDTNTYDTSDGSYAADYKPKYISKEEFYKDRKFNVHNKFK